MRRLVAVRPSRKMLRQEFIGMNATIVSPGIHSPITGKIVDETKNMILLERAGKELSISKKGSRISLRLDKGEVEILGDWIVGSPEDRIKKRIRRSIL